MFKTATLGKGYRLGAGIIDGHGIEYMPVRLRDGGEAEAAPAAAATTVHDSKVAGSGTCGPNDGTWKNCVASSPIGLSSGEPAYAAIQKPFFGSRESGRNLTEVLDGELESGWAAEGLNASSPM